LNNLEIFSWILVVYGLIGFWITGKHRIGWLMAISFQVGWVYYAWSIGAMALAIQSVAFGIIAYRNYVVGGKK